MDDAALLIDPQATSHTIDGFNINYSEQNEWRAMGECIGRHENLACLYFRNVNSTHQNWAALLMGVDRNRSLEVLTIDSCRGEWPLGILGMLFQNNENLGSLFVTGCSRGITSSLSAALANCTSESLEVVGHGSREDEAVEEFYQALAGLPQLKRLYFQMGMQPIGHFGPRGCGAMAALLQRPACMLQCISIASESIDDGILTVLGPAVAASNTLVELALEDVEDMSTEAFQLLAGVLRSPNCPLENLAFYNNIICIEDDDISAFADALATNRRLKELIFRDDDHEISQFGFAAVTRALCNTSSIDAVHSSNHTLKCLMDFHGLDDDEVDELPSDLQSYLLMNRREDKSLVAREKILMHFFRGEFNMTPFHENVMPPNTWPHLLRWIGRMPDGESLTALFNFIRRMPHIWRYRTHVLRRSTRKRKVRN